MQKTVLLSQKEQDLIGGHSNNWNLMDINITGIASELYQAA